MRLIQFNPKIQPNQMPSEGQYKLLNDGNEMGVLIVMLREAVQNSWDARIRNNQNITFTLRGLNLSRENTSAIYKAIGKEGAYGFELSQAIRNVGNAIEISDSNTIGLSGPTGFDNLDEEDKKNRFIKFVHTLGNGAQSAGDGGSFGFGKTSLYKASKVGTVAIYTKTEVDDGTESRFIIKNLDKSGNKRFSNSGVYWWGKEIIRSENADVGTWIEPLKNYEADELWSSIGGTRFGELETGVKLMVFAPELSRDYPKSGKSILHANLEHLAKNVTHYFWAKWPEEASQQGIEFKFSISDNGNTSEIRIDHPDEVYPYQVLRTSLKASKNKKIDTAAKESYQTKEIKSYQPAQSLGNLVYAVIDDRKINREYDEFFNSEVCHIALLRNVEFVVDYFNHSVNIDFMNDNVESEKKIVGVFRTYDNCMVYIDTDKSVKKDLNEVYRTAENQTHGSWSSENALSLGRYSRTYINKTFDEIKAGLNSFVREQRAKKVDRSAEANAQIMSYLGQFISGVQGGGQPFTGSSTSTSSYPTNQKAPPKSVYFEIISVDGPNHVNGTRNMVLECILESESLQDRIKLVPICADEEGKMTIRPDKTSSLPVRIQSVETDPDASVITTEYGIAELSSERKRLDLKIQLNLTGDCRFVIKVER